MLLELRQAEQNCSVLLELRGKPNLEITAETIQKAGWPNLECHWCKEVRSPRKVVGDYHVVVDVVDYLLSYHSVVDYHVVVDYVKDNPL